MGADDDTLLGDVLKDILDSFSANHQLLGQLRYVWMALIFAIIVEPTLKYYHPDSQIPEVTIAYLTNWLIQTLEQILTSDRKSPSFLDNDNIDVTKLVDFRDFLFSVQEVSSLQVISEVLDVYLNALKTPDQNQSLSALLNILEDCLEGYAIFPGSDGRRKLFNWWLLDVIPHCWYLLPPNSIDLLNDPRDSSKNYPLSRLEKISSSMWGKIQANIQSHDNYSVYPLLNSCYKTASNFSNEVAIHIRYSKI